MSDVEHKDITGADLHVAGPVTTALIGTEQSADPSAPDSGKRALYAKSDGWYDEDADGTVAPLVAGVEGGWAALDSGLLVPVASLPIIESLTTDETDTTKVLAPDGSGGVHFRAETGGGGGGGGSYTDPLVQAKTSAPQQTNSRTLTMDAAPTVGNILIAAIANEAQDTVSSITQTGVTWTLIVQAPSGKNGRCELWLGTIASGAGTGVTAAMSGNHWGGLIVAEFTGFTGTSDQTDTSTYTYNVSTAPLNSVGPITPSSATALVVAVLGYSGFSSNFGATTAGTLGLRCIPDSWSARSYLPFMYGVPGAVPCGMNGPYPLNATGTGCIASLT